MSATKKEIISRLRKDILQWEGYRAPSAGTRGLMGLGPLESAFPNEVFPLGTVNEMICNNTEQTAASGGFISGLLSVLHQLIRQPVSFGTKSFWRCAGAGYLCPPFAGQGRFVGNGRSIEMHRARSGYWRGTRSGL